MYRKVVVKSDHVKVNIKEILKYIQLAFTTHYRLSLALANTSRWVQAMHKDTFQTRRKLKQWEFDPSHSPNH